MTFLAFTTIASNSFFGIDSTNVNDDCITPFENEWYSKHLKCMGESSLYNFQKADIEIYRFTWLRTFHHPYVVTIIFDSLGKGKVIIKMTDGAGGYAPGNLKRNDTLQLDEKTIKTIKIKFDKISFWTLATHNDDDGKDGAEWILEVRNKDKYHMVKRWSPESGDFRSFCLYILKIGKIKEKEIY